MTVRACVLVAAFLCFAGVGTAGSMARRAEYLMKPRLEIALARSAAPASISSHATVLVLGMHGYVAAVKGNNGFTCLVERAWMQPFNRKSFWNLRFRAPVCYNAAAARSVLMYTLKQTALALNGASKAQIEKKMLAAIATKSLPAPQPDAMAYMMSKQQYLGNAAKAWYPHVMLYMPSADTAKNGAAWGADRAGSPVVYDGADMMPQPWAQFFIPVSHWSDGSAAPSYTGT